MALPQTSESGGIQRETNKIQAEFLLPEKRGISDVEEKQILRILRKAPSEIPEKTKSFAMKNIISGALFVLSDTISVFLPFYIYSYILGKGSGVMQALLYALASFLGVSALSQLYSKRFPFWDEVWRVLRSGAISSAVLYLLSYLGGFEFNLVVCALFVPFSILFRGVMKELMWIFGLRRKAIIIGGGLGGTKVLKALDSERGLGYEILGVLDDDRKKLWKSIGTFRGQDVLVIGKTEDIWQVIDEMEVDEVILAIPSLGDKALTALAIHLQKFVPVVTIVPDMFGLPVTVELGHSFGEQTIFLSVKNNLANPLNVLVKEIFDRVVGMIIFIIIMPLMGVIALLIKLDSPGPVFFSHERVGKRGKRFKCYKFRTMYVNNEEILKEHFKKHPEDFKIYIKTGKIPGRDPRVTPLGRFLRKFSLDELPQIINVLKGEMSLVGPRALVPFEAEQCKDYYLEWARYIKPGITGLAQVMGRANISHVDKNIISLWYMRNWSLWLDIVILFKTIKVVLRTEGAY